MNFEVAEEAIPFALSQTIRRKPHLPTEAEQRRLATWNSRFGNSLDPDVWDTRPELPRWDFLPTDELKIDIGGWPRPQGVTHLFTDSRSRRLEDVSLK